jgi:hypothetical protein
MKSEVIPWLDAICAAMTTTRPLKFGWPAQVHTFDSFECAIHALAPTCAHCGCKIVGHGVEAEGRFYCCAHCAHQVGIGGLRDRA